MQYYTKNTLENMASVNLDPIKSNFYIRGKTVRLVSSIRSFPINIKEISIFDERNNKLTILQSFQSSQLASGSTDNSVEKATDNRSDTYASTGPYRAGNSSNDAHYHYLTFTLDREQNISRILIFNEYESITNLNNMRDVQVQILNSDNSVILWTYYIDSLISPIYNIPVMVKYPYVSGKTITIQSFDSLPFKLAEVSFYDDLGKIIPSNTITISQSLGANGNNLKDMNYSTTVSDSSFTFNLGTDKKISRIIINNDSVNPRSTIQNYIYGVELTIKNNNQDIVYKYFFDKNLPSYEIFINESDWQVYKNDTILNNNSYTPIKKIDNNYYCMTTNNTTCLFTDFITAYNNALEPSNLSSQLLLNNLLLPNNTFTKVNTTPTDLATCNTDMTTCNTEKTTALENLATCNTNLTTCNTDKNTVQAEKTTALADLATCNIDKTTALANLTTALADLATCNIDKTTALANLTTCNTNKNIVQTEKTTALAAKEESQLALITALQDKRTVITSLNNAHKQISTQEEEYNKLTIINYVSYGIICLLLIGLIYVYFKQRSKKIYLPMDQ